MVVSRHEMRAGMARATTVIQQVCSMKNFLVSLALVAIFGVAGAQDVVYQHELEVSIDQETSRLEVKDKITVTESRTTSELEITLHKHLVSLVMNAHAYSLHTAK